MSAAISGMALLFHRDLELTAHVLDDKERHRALVAQVFHKAGNAVTRTGYDIGNIGSFHVFSPFFYGLFFSLY